MTTHELLGKECLPFTDVFVRISKEQMKLNYSMDCRDLVSAHIFLTQPLTPEWVEKYLDLDFTPHNTIHVGNFYEIYWSADGKCILTKRGQSMIIKHPSHLFESLPPQIKLQYKNVEI